jgi:hypothetical protein
VMPVSCPDCQEKQVIHLRARAGFGQMGPQVVECLKCHTGFEVMVPDDIIAGPFPLEP